MNKIQHEILEQVYTPPIVNKKTIEGIKNHSKLYRGHVRTSIGKIYKSGEFQKKREAILRRTLP